MNTETLAAFFSTNPLGIGLAIAIIASPLFIVNRWALTAKHSKLISTIALSALAGGILWRAFSGPFIVPTLPPLAAAAVMLLHAATGGYFGSSNSDFMKKRINKARCLSETQKAALLSELETTK